MKPRRSACQPAVRHEYERHGVEGFYSDRGASYRNPHEPQVRRTLEIVTREWPMDLSRVLDLAAGSGEVTTALEGLGAGAIAAIDPFTFEAFERRVGRPAGRQTFQQIAGGALDSHRYSLIICSYALHLIEPSRLPQVCWRLSHITGQLLILTPHKRPAIRMAWGWELTHEMVVERVRARLYRSHALPP